jgi:predicted DsbA family dithiol-disulfide isomerase
MRFLSRILATFCLLFVLAGSETFPQEKDAGIPWAVLPILQSLDEGRRSDLLELLKQQPNYGVCRGTILGCLLQEKPDGTAVRLANFGAYLLSKGVPLKFMGDFFARRQTFAESAQVHEFDCSTAPVYGNEKAAITLTEFAEFKCPMCGTVSPVLKKLVDESNGAVRLCFKHYPILSHQGTILASKSAVAAQRQGKFWEMAALLYENMDRNEQNQILDLASNLGLDMARFKKDMADPEVEKLVRADKVEGVKSKVNATPTLFINGRLYELRMDEAYLQDILNEEAERIGIDPPYKNWVYR